jgi:hypothetical protein
MSNITRITPSTACAFTAEAVMAIARMRDRIDSIRYWHGPDEAARASLTLATSLTSLIAMGGTVYGDRIGDSGLLNVVAHTDAGITVGLVFHREELSTTLARTNPDRTGDESLALLGDVTVAVMAESGSWSLHS